MGILTVGLTIWLGLAEPRKWLRMLGILALASVVAQGILGGLRVTQLVHWLAIPHACLAQTFFSLMAAIALFTSPGWRRPTERITGSGSAPLPRVCLAATLAIYFQLVAGAVQRHNESLIGIPLWVHLGGAVAVMILAVRASRYVLIGFGHQRELSNPARIGLALLGTQLVLGAGSFGVRWVSVDDPQPAVSTVAVTTAHVAIGALLLMTYLILTLQSYRLVKSPVRGNTPSTIAKGAVA